MDVAPRDGQVHAPRRGAARLVVAAAVLVALGAASGRASAQSPTDIARARQWFKEGEALEAKGDCAGAIGKFEQAVGVKETPQLRLRIGACQESKGDLLAARGSFERALSVATAVGNADASAVARDRLAAVDARIPKLTVTAASAPPGLRGTLDGEPLSAGALGAPKRVPPGDHVVHAEAEGYAPFDRTVSLGQGGAVSVAVELGRAAPTAAAPAPIAVPPAPATATGASPLPWVLVGGGAAAIAGGVVLWVVQAGKDSAVDDLCGGADRLACPASKRDDIESRVSSVNALRGASIAVGGVGVVAAGVGVALLVRSRNAPARADAHRLWPTSGPAPIGVGLGGAF
jgi:hypothetical protein